MICINRTKRHLELLVGFGVGIQIYNNTNYIKTTIYFYNFYQSKLLLIIPPYIPTELALYTNRGTEQKTGKYIDNSKKSG